MPTYKVFTRTTVKEGDSYIEVPETFTIEADFLTTSDGEASFYGRDALISTVVAVFPSGYYTRIEMGGRVTKGSS